MSTYLLYQMASIEDIIYKHMIYQALLPVT